VQQRICAVGRRLRQLVLLCGHYEGFDERIARWADLREVSIRVIFVLTGGELRR